MDLIGRGKTAALFEPWNVNWRYVIGFAICAAGCLLLLGRLVEQLAGHSPQMAAALLGGGMAAAATALGTLPVLLSRNLSKRSYDCCLGFGAGVMLAATAFSLIVPALAAARGQGLGPLAASAGVGAGIFVGAAALLALDRLMRPDHLAPGPEAAAAKSLKLAWLFVLAVSLHNVPEGMAIGVAYAGIDVEQANILATGISIQDIPEGLVVALALRGAGYGRLPAVGMGVASGLVEPVAAVFGVALIGVSAALLPFALAAAAGAMLLVLTHDVVPASHRSGNSTYASGALVLGFILMTVLDTALA